MAGLSLYHGCNQDEDIAFSLDGSDLGANAVMDLGEVDFKSIDGNQDIGYLTMGDAIPGHFYLIKRADATTAKLRILQHENSVISIEYALQGVQKPPVKVLSSIKIAQKHLNTVQPLLC
jgi:hypothetical protein